MRKSTLIRTYVVLLPAIAILLVIAVSSAFGDTKENITDPLIELKNQHDKLTLESGIVELTLQKKLAALQAEIEEITKKLDLANKSAALKETEKKVKEDDELSDMKFKVEKQKLSSDLADLENTEKLKELDIRKEQYLVRLTELEVQRKELDSKIDLLNNDLRFRISRTS